MKKLIILLIGLFVATNCFGFETQTAVENSKYAAAVMRETGVNVEALTIGIAKEYLVLIAKNTDKPCDVFNWSDEQADEVTNVVDCFCRMAFLSDKTNEDWIAYMNLVGSTASLVETFGFERDEALNIAAKTIKDLNERYGE